MLGIDPKEAAKALDDIDDIVRRVRQSRFYNLASQFLILWGVLVLVGNLATWVWPHYGSTIWICINVAGFVSSVVIGTLDHRRTRIRTFDLRIMAVFIFYVVFGLLFSTVIGHFTPRQMGAFWPIYAMLFYTLAGLWVGYAFVAIGLAITSLTLIGYFFMMGAGFLPWMAVVNGGGLILGGLWMRWS